MPTECDRLAAHIVDLDKVSVGMNWGVLNLDQVIKACKQAGDNLIFDGRNEW